MTGLWLALGLLGVELVALGWLAWAIRCVGRSQR